MHFYGTKTKFYFWKEYLVDFIWRKRHEKWRKATYFLRASYRYLKLRNFWNWVLNFDNISKRKWYRNSGTHFRQYYFQRFIFCLLRDIYSTSNVNKWWHLKVFHFQSNAHITASRWRMALIFNYVSYKG